MTQPLPRMAILGRLGTPQLACLRSWRRGHVPCLFLHADKAPLPRVVQALLGVPCVHLGPLRLDDPAWVARLSEVLARHRVQAITCVSEPISEALWAVRGALPAMLGIVSVKPEQVRVLESKISQDELARRSGLDTLPSWHWAAGQRAEVPADAFPLVLRPDVASRAEPAFKVAVVNTLAELQAVIDRMAVGSSRLIAQPLVRGPNLLVHGYRSADGRWGGHVAFRVEVKYQGLSVVLRPVRADPAVLAGCARMEQALGLSGVFHHEFIEDEHSGRTCFLDLNPRLGGTSGKVLSSGYDEPMALVGSLVPGCLDSGCFMKHPLRGAGGKHQALRALASALRGTSSAADYPYPDFSRTLRALLRYLVLGRDEILRAADWRSALAFGLYQLRKRLQAI